MSNVEFVLLLGFFVGWEASVLAATHRSRQTEAPPRASPTHGMRRGTSLTRIDFFFATLPAATLARSPGALSRLNPSQGIDVEVHLEWASESFSAALPLEWSDIQFLLLVLRSGGCLCLSFLGPIFNDDYWCFVTTRGHAM